MFDTGPVLAGLKNFQLDAVAHVCHQFYGPGAQERSGRFLIADETGLGKSVIARGVVAETIKRLQGDGETVTIVYICSNSDLAAQNIERLNVTEQKDIVNSSRLTLLARDQSRARAASDNASNTKSSGVKLVAFTPGTSFSVQGWHLGNADERALIVVMLNHIRELAPVEWRRACAIFQGGVHKRSSFETIVRKLEASLVDGPDAHIQRQFQRLVAGDGALTRFHQLISQMPDPKVPNHLAAEVRSLVANFRTILAQASVEAIRPNLVILDEFQRFSQLLDSQAGAAAELLESMTSDDKAKVLLLSATPYKPFTRADESDGDHYEDFYSTIRYLHRGDSSKVNQIRSALAEYRRAVVTGGDGTDQAANVRSQLTEVMTRSERPSKIEERSLVQDSPWEVPVPTQSELKDWLSLARLGEAALSPINPEYWKSIPYFASFMSGYQIGRHIQKAEGADEQAILRRCLKATRRIVEADVNRWKKLDAANPQLRALMAKTLDRGWWKLLWLPPSMPYLKPGPVYSQFSGGGVTKHVLFSGWSATPAALASLLSYEAERRMLGISDSGRPPDTVTSTSQRFTYKRHDDQGQSMSTLAMFWPHPELLTYADQLQSARGNEGTIDAAELVKQVKRCLPQGDPAERAWEAFFSFRGAMSDELRQAAIEISQSTQGGDGSVAGLTANLDSVAEFVASNSGNAVSHPELARLAAFSPGGVAYRAISSIAGDGCTAMGKWRAAFTIAEGIRSLFNRPEAQTLLDQLAPDGVPMAPYWSRVLDYCADGNLRAVLDEYIFQLWCETGRQEQDDTRLLGIAQRAAAAFTMRQAQYHAYESPFDDAAIRLPARFAVRYGDGTGEGLEATSAAERKATVRGAFNSPFAPFILTSTSVGQEGIDFHWWSHSVIHWNLPSSPVDFEQREGRVNRYGGHAVRKNVAQAHWPDVIDSNDPCAWRAAFEAAESVSAPDAGDFSPWWAYAGEAQIQRVLAPYPLSRDIQRYAELRRSLALYRLTLGQPRQEDMVSVMERRNVDGQQIASIDLRPPRRHNSDGL